MRWPKLNLAGCRHIGMKVLDQLYPPWCVFCEKALHDGRNVCDSCLADLPQITAPFCEVCSEPFEGKIGDHFSCPNCAKLTFSFDFARSAMMRNPQTLELIHRLKYGREIHLAAELASLAHTALSDARFERALAEKWPLVPVPLHFRRQQNRHFNQATEIAMVLSKLAGLPMLPMLKRTRNTTTQTLLTRKQRLENLRGAFSLTHHGSLWRSQKRHGIILVDDIFTTGSTVHECAKACRKAGLQQVQVLTVMRG